MTFANGPAGFLSRRLPKGAGKLGKSLGGALLALTVLSLAAAAPARAGFATCLASIRGEALRSGITASTFDTYAGTLRGPNDVLQFVGAQPEFTTPVWDYLGGLVDDERVADGRADMQRYHGPLMAAAHRFGVDPYVLVALWGVESNYGQGFGRRLILPSLATLACSDLGRAGYFRREFIAALRIVQSGDVRADRLYGSWAGAFGQTQFMPTTFLRYAVDMDGDGRRDVVDSIPDALGSTANYLRGHGWVPGLGWGLEVRLPAGYRGPSGRRAKHPFRFWAAKGLLRVDGRPLGAGPAAGLLLPAGPRGPAFLVTRNFDAILSYNSSEAYALAVALLSERLRGHRGLVTPWPGGERGLSRAERREVQRLLAARGYDVGEPDGVLGAKSRRAMVDFEAKAGLPRDGAASARLLTALRGGAADGGGLFKSLFSNR